MEGNKMGGSEVGGSEMGGSEMERVSGRKWWERVSLK